MLIELHDSQRYDMQMLLVDDFVAKIWHSDVRQFGEKQRVWRDALNTLKRTNARLVVPFVSYNQVCGALRVDDMLWQLSVGLRGVYALLDMAAALRIGCERVNWTIFVYL